VKTLSAETKAILSPYVERATDQPLYAFLASAEAGYVHPHHMVAALHAMHATLVDRFPAVSLWMSIDLEQTADLLTKAIECAERQEQDYPEEVEA